MSFNKFTALPTSMRIAILEDDPSQLELLGHWIALGGHDPQRFGHGQDLLKAISQESFGLLILRSRVPVIFCNARDNQDDIVAGLREGAEDLLDETHPPNGAVGTLRSGDTARTKDA